MSQESNQMVGVSSPSQKKDKENSGPRHKHSLKFPLGKERRSREHFPFSRVHVINETERRHTWMGRKEYTNYRHDWIDEIKTNKMAQVSECRVKIIITQRNVFFVWKLLVYFIQNFHYRDIHLTFSF